MSGIFDSIFGSNNSKTVTTPSAAGLTSPVSFNLATTNGAQLQSGIGGGFVRTTPLIRQGLGSFGQNTKGQLGRLGNTISRFSANENPFIQARVNPLRNEMANRRADLSRSISQRGVVGSLGNNELMRFDRNADMQLGDATALATQDALSALLNAEGAYQGVNQDVLRLADNYLKQDLTELGLNLEAMNSVIGSRQNLGGGTTVTTGGSQGVGGLLSGLGSLFTGIGQL